MPGPGAPSSPLRVAIIGAGPSAFYAAEHLLKQGGLAVEIDMFDRLPTPYGLVRVGVAPDHQKIKTVTKAFARVAADPRLRFYGYVEYGADITLDDLRTRYHQVLFATGAPSDKRMGIPGEDLKGSHPATHFVAWYNGHPDYRDYSFELDAETAVIVGVGNVAIDVARILCLSEAELRVTDMADYAIEALINSRIRDVYLLGRRGPAQAAFTNPEIKELGDLAETDIVVRPEEAELDELSRTEVEEGGDRSLSRKVELIQSYTAREPVGRKKRLHLRFLVSPEELVAGADGQVAGVRTVRNRLAASESGAISAIPTDERETIPAGLVFRSVGYRGAPLPGIPFHDRWGVILNDAGRIIDPESQQPIPGLYTSGWIKRGPSGVIGTNKPDSVETVTFMIEDYSAGHVLTADCVPREACHNFILERKPNCFSFDDWLHLDQLELAAGQAQGRPRVKFTTIESMLAALER